MKIPLSLLIPYLLSDEKMSFLGATLGNLHIPSIGGIKKQISKVRWIFLYNIYYELLCSIETNTLEGKANGDILSEQSWVYLNFTASNKQDECCVSLVATEYLAIPGDGREHINLASDHLWC